MLGNKEGILSTEAFQSKLSQLAASTHQERIKAIPSREFLRKELDWVTA